MCRPDAFLEVGEGLQGKEGGSNTANLFLDAQSRATSKTDAGSGGEVDLSKAHRAQKEERDAAAMNEDEKRLFKLGYRQEVKRIFAQTSNFGLTTSMVSVMLGVVPLYTYSLKTGGPAGMVWGWFIVGIFSFAVVSSIAEISSSFPTMGALYYRK